MLECRRGISKDAPVWNPPAINFDDLSEAISYREAGCQHAYFTRECRRDQKQADADGVAAEPAVVFKRSII